MMRKRSLALVLVFGLFIALGGCGGGGDGGGGVLPGDQQPGDQQPGDQQPPPGSVDTDNDGVTDAEDNCPTVANGDQADNLLADGNNGQNGVGDVCEPTGTPDSYTWIMNAPLIVTDTAQGVLTNASFVDTVTDFGIGCSFVGGCANQGATAIGGSIEVGPTGIFLYTPPPFASIPNAPAAGEPGLQADGSVVDRFFTIANSDVVSTVTGPPVPVTLTLPEAAWFVENDTTAATPNGSLGSPFATLRDAQAASVAGDFIFVLTGNGTTLGQDIGIFLKDDQRLIGQGIDFVYPAFSVNGGAAISKAIMMPTAGQIAGTAIVAGTHPAITNTGVQPPGVAVGAPVELANNNEVAGIRLLDSNEEKIMGGLFPEALGDAMAGITGFNIHDNIFEESAGSALNNAEDIFLFAAGGTGVIADNTMTGAQREAIRFINFDPANPNFAGNAFLDINGTLNVTGNTIDSPAQSGLHVELGNTAAGTSNLTLNVSGNTISAVGAGEDGMDLQAHNAASLTATIGGNGVNGSANVGNEGINIDANDAATVAATLTGNTIGGFNFEGVNLQSNDNDLNAATVPVFNALVDGNTLNNNALGGGGAGLFANAEVSTSFCLELTNNSSTGNGSLVGYSINADGATLTLVHDEVLAPNTGDPLVIDVNVIQAGTINQGTCGGL